MTQAPTPESIRRFWDLDATTYDSKPGHGIHHDVEREAWTDLLERFLPSQRPLRVADLGCGTGAFALLLAGLGHHVVGVDVSSQMLAIAAGKAAEAGLTIDFRSGDAARPPVEAGSLDAIVSRHLLWTLPDPTAAVRSWCDVLVPGGTVLAVDGFWWRSGLVTTLRSSLKRSHVRMRDGEHPYAQGRRSSLPLARVSSVEPARHVFEEGGLVAVESEPLDVLDRIERKTMPLRVRLTTTWRRYAVWGTAPG
jgi:SAM-dependent methyltransferase